MNSGEVAGWIGLWDRLVPHPPRQRRRELLVHEGAPASPLSVGGANARLLRLHREMFGPQLSCRAACPACGEGLELDADVEALLAGETAVPAEPARVQVEGWEVSFRVPTEEDVDAVGAEADPDAARLRLLQRCVLSCSRGAQGASIDQAPAEVAARIDAEMEQIDPLAVLDFELKCGRCGHGWLAPLDVGTFLWARLDAWVRRLLHEIHILAKAYGWSEETIAAMSPWKRQAYLDLVSG